jgi:hypothetical protein
MVEGLAGIIGQLDRQKAAIDKALAALRGIEGITEPTEAPAGIAPSAPAKRKGGMTPEGKLRLIAALKKRWAAKKRAAKKGAAAHVETAQAATIAETPAPRKPNFTPEGRQRLAEAMKRRWAVKRAASAVKKRGRKKAA